MFRMSAYQPLQILPDIAYNFGHISFFLSIFCVKVFFLLLQTMIEKKFLYHLLKKLLVLSAQDVIIKKFINLRKD